MHKKISNASAGALEHEDSSEKRALQDTVIDEFIRICKVKTPTYEDAKEFFLEKASQLMYSQQSGYKWFKNAIKYNHGITIFAKDKEGVSKFIILNDPDLLKRIEDLKLLNGHCDDVELQLQISYDYDDDKIIASIFFSEDNKVSFLENCKCFLDIYQLTPRMLEEIYIRKTNISLRWTNNRPVYDNFIKGETIKTVLFNLKRRRLKINLSDIIIANRGEYFLLLRFLSTLSKNSGKIAVGKSWMFILRVEPYKIELLPVLKIFKGYIKEESIKQSEVFHFREFYLQGGIELHNGVVTQENEDVLYDYDAGHQIFVMRCTGSDPIIRMREIIELLSKYEFNFNVYEIECYDRILKSKMYNYILQIIKGRYDTILVYVPLTLLSVAGGVGLGSIRRLKKTIKRIRKQDRKKCSLISIKINVDCTNMNQYYNELLSKLSLYLPNSTIKLIRDYLNLS